MPKKAKELAAYQVKAIKKPGLHAVGGVDGLCLNVKTSGARSWIQRYMFAGRRREAGLGSYPSVSLAQARDRGREIRDKAWRGIDPIEERRAAQDAIRAESGKRITFDDAARRCHKARVSEFRNAKHKKDWISSLERYASPKIGSMPVADIEVPHVVAVLEPIWHSKTETATRVRQRIEAVLAWATVGKFRRGENPAQWKGNLEFVLPKPSKLRRVKHHAALPWPEVGSFMAELRERDGMGARALEFAILTAARSGEVRLATWDEIDLDAKLWTIPGERMKAGNSHKVPLSGPAIAVLNKLPRMVGSEFVFPAARGGPLSDMSMSAVCRRMKVEAVPHGFRSSFKDWARSSTSYADEVSELALSHVNSDATRAAYARDELLQKRSLLMRDWAAFCSNESPGGEVTSIRGRSGS